MKTVTDAKAERTDRIPIWGILGAAAAFMLFLWPLLYLFREAFIGMDGGFSLEHFRELAGDGSFGKVIFNSLLINTGATLLSAALGICFAYVMAYTDIPLKKMIHTLLLLPLVIPSYIVTLAWMQMFLKTSIFYRITHFELYSYAGIILMFAVCQYPMVYLLCLSHFRKIPRELEQAADISGCGRWKRFTRITMPLTKGTLANAMLLVFLSCLDNFGIVAFIGIPANIQVLSTDIYKTIISVTDNSFSLAAVKAIVLSAVALAIILLARKISEGTQAGGSEKEDLMPRIILNKWKYLILAAMGMFLALVNVIPFLTLITSALTKAKGVAFSLETASLANFDKVLHNSKCLNGLRNSIFLAVAAALVCGVIGVSISYFGERKHSPIARQMQNMITFPYSIPGIILGLSLILTYARSFHGFTIYGTIWILLLSYVIRFTSVILRSSNTAFAQLDAAMEEAAQASGAGTEPRWRRVILPLTSGPIASGLGLVMISSLMELTTSSLLWSGGSETVGVVIFNFTSAGMSNLASAYSSLILLLLLAAAGCVRLTGVLWKAVRKKR